MLSENPENQFENIAGQKLLKLLRFLDLPNIVIVVNATNPNFSNLVAEIQFLQEKAKVLKIFFNIK